MKNRITLIFVTLLIISALAWWNSSVDVAASAENRIAIIEDINGDLIGVEPTSDEVWNRLVELYHTRDEMWIGGVVEVFIFIRPDPNYAWGFRFKPETIIVAEVTAEGLQTAISDICENLDYWQQLGQAYVFAKVVDYSIYSDLNDDQTVDILDIATAAKAYGSKQGDQNWNEFADLDRNAIVNIIDISMIAKDYGETIFFPEETVARDYLYKNTNLELETIILDFLKTTDVPNGVWDGYVGVKEIYDHKLGGKVMVVEYSTSTAGHPDFFLDTIEHHIAVITLNFNREVVSAFCVWSSVHDSEIWDLLNQRWVNLRSQEEGFGIYLREDDRLVVSGDDFVSYNQTSHEIKLTKFGVGKIEELNFSVFGQPFVVKIDGEEIYNGTFMTPISSLRIASSEAVIVTLVQNDTIKIQIGYPDTEPADRDPRNDSRVFDFFQKTGKLIQWEVENNGK